jgi:hypothetical protein
VLTLDGNVLGIEFPSFDKFGELFSDRCLGCNRIGSDYLNPAEFYPLGRSTIAIEYPDAGFSGHLFVHQYHSTRLIETESLFIYHGYSMCWTYLRAYSTAFAVFHIYLDGYGFTNNSIWTIEPAQKTGRLVLSN